MYLYSYIYDNKDSSSTCPEKKKPHILCEIEIYFYFEVILENNFVLNSYPLIYSLWVQLFIFC